VIRSARKIHKWLMAFIGIQFLIWAITGAYMVTLDIHFIHGETLQKQSDSTLDLSVVSYGINDVVSRYPDAKNLTVEKFQGRLVYQLRSDSPEPGWKLLDASDGSLLPAIDEASARQLASDALVKKLEVSNIQLISELSDMPSEVSPRYLPFWRVEFDGFGSPTFYISQHTGKVVTKRHTFWRLFDWMWRFHIMDYDDGENVSNWFLLLIASLGMLAALTGAVLTYFRIFRAGKKEAQHEHA